jgi:hypothetical protein
LSICFFKSAICPFRIAETGSSLSVRKQLPLDRAVIGRIWSGRAFSQIARKNNLPDRAPALRARTVFIRRPPVLIRATVAVFTVPPDGIDKLHPPASRSSKSSGTGGMSDGSKSSRFPAGLRASYGLIVSRYIQKINEIIPVLVPVQRAKKRLRMVWRHLVQTTSKPAKQGVTCMSDKNLRNEMNRFRPDVSELKDEVQQSQEEKGASQPTSLQEQVAGEIMSRPVRPDEEAKQQYPGR